MKESRLGANLIHPSAVVGPEVRISEGNQIGPNVVLLGRIDIGCRNYLAPGVTIDATAFGLLESQHLVVTIGDDNYLGNGVSLGAPSRQRFADQHRTEPLTVRPEVVIGNHVIMHDFVTVHAPVVWRTEVSDGAVVGAHSHVSHDCLIMAHSILAAGTLLGGYCAIGSNSTLGLGVRVHPRVAVGPVSMVGAGAVVLEHVPPAATVAGSPARLLGINERGLTRVYGASDSLAESFRDALDAGSDNGSAQTESAWKEFGDLINSPRHQRSLLTRWADE